jgi:hypothetical protein
MPEWGLYSQSAASQDQDQLEVSARLGLGLVRGAGRRCTGIGLASLQGLVLGTLYLLDAVFG